MTILATSRDFVPASREPAARWQTVLRQAVRDVGELCRLLELPESFAKQARAARGPFPLLVPRGYVARMERGNPADPLLRQVLPQADEAADLPGYSADPVGDRAAERAPGLLHKYRGRALLVLTGACAVHCRYCFRREFPYSEVPHTPAAWEPALAEIAHDPSLAEVILSGGDPLMLVDQHLERLVARLESIDHVHRLRLHTRLPIVLPERVDERLLAWLSSTRLHAVVVVHANHPAELSPEVGLTLARLRDAGAMLLNQAVLLRGVNDDVNVLAELSERLQAQGVMPYYLHQLDRVTGAAHFEVEESRGRQIIESLRERLPGYLVPRYVREVAGAPFKVPLDDLRPNDGEEPV
ncbi:MAG: EF-P beta-lysylation protein EpmB [Pirellulales bacterium]|nr:EF-P beta-lysylation protein EpmB [Pirellulales bacterium]